MNYKLTFALLLYINVFYFGLYAIFELCLLLIKGYSLTDTRYNAATFINEIFILAFMVVVESLRLLLGQQLQPSDFDKRLSVVFRILVLTVPSIYAVAFFTFWQAKITSLDFALGLVMLIIQSAQCCSIFLQLWYKSRTEKEVRYTRIKPNPDDDD